MASVRLMHIRDLIRLVGFMFVGLLFGTLIGQVAWGLFLSVLAHTIFLCCSLEALLRWVRARKEHEPPEYVGVFEDLVLEIDYLRDRHRKRKKKLASYIKQFQQATRALPDATVVLDNQDQVRWANGAAEKMLGVRWPEDVGQRVTNLIRDPKLRDFMAREDLDESISIEIDSPTLSGRHLNVLSAPYGDKQRLLVARDVTQLHRANQIRSDFVANVSHELRTPITVFRGYLETLTMKQTKVPAEWDNALEHMTAQAERMRILVEELLLLSRLESEDSVPHPVTVNVAALITDIHAQARELSGEAEHLFSLEVDSDLHLKGSPEELFSALSNIVFNAIHYTQARGIVQIRWSRTDTGGAEFSVTDNGRGISTEHLPRLTERFYRVDGSRDRQSYNGGTGLGLAIVKHVLTRHDAKLLIESTAGSGSCFTARFSPNAVAKPPLDRDTGVRDVG